MRTVTADYVVVGSGIAGLTAALAAASLGSVIVIAKGPFAECNSVLAQGGIAAAIGSHDSPRLHSQDTLRAGAGLSRRTVVELLTEEAPRVIEGLLRLGTRFDRTDCGELALGREGAHSTARVLHHGDQTGAEIWRALSTQAQAMGSIACLPETEALELLTEAGVCYGLVAATQGELICFLARAVILATGGCGRIFGRTTNSPAATGDGLALAWRAGATLTDLEFMQFHPTALALGESPLFLISEAVRGEGAVLVTEEGRRFMPAYHSMADLAPRDIVSRAILEEQATGRKVYLDATRIGGAFASRFPQIYRRLREAAIDPERQWIPVTPAAHFLMGGIKTDSFGRTNVRALFACGEVAGTGVHGANRLASNSLLEALVFGRRIAVALAHQRQQMGTKLWRSASSAAFRGIGDPVPLAGGDARLKRLQQLMWENVGIIRDGAKMAAAIKQLEHLEQEVSAFEYELKNMVAVAKLMTMAALRRKESRGSHYRLDYPQPLEQWRHTHFQLGRDSA